MSMIEQFQKLDDLIIEHTAPPVLSLLRNQLALTREQVEAYQERSDQQDATLSAQLKAYDALAEKVKQLTAKIEQMETKEKKDHNDWMMAQAEKARRLSLSKSINVRKS